MLYADKYATRATSTLGRLIYCIEAGNRALQELTEEYEDEQIHLFSAKRQSDLEEFLKLVKNITKGTPVYEVSDYLRYDKKAASKFYGGICKRGYQYFKPSKSIERLMSEEDNKNYYQQLEDKVEEEFQVSDDYKIFDEK
ncbi:MAG: hypothetical protein PHR25_03910 [Clostridia bacterium]|nr:hypothetical protein [Clostridia bacterium]MDD4375907.1 hypothetical protein [Clostridia bacterium]